MADTMNAPEGPFEFRFPAGSFVVERYVYSGPKGGKGVQWIVSRIEKDGSLSCLIACDTRREAAEYVAKGKL